MTKGRSVVDTWQAVLRYLGILSLVAGVVVQLFTRAVVRAVYEFRFGPTVGSLLAGGSREEPVDFYLEIAGPYRLTLVVWLAILGLGFLALAQERCLLLDRVRSFPPTVILTVTYLLAWGGLIASLNGVYWDDWGFFNQSPKTTFLLHAEGGRPLNNLYDIIVRTAGTTTLSLLSLTIFLGSGLAFFRILERAGHGTQGERLVAAGLFLALPFNAARQAYAVFQYTFGLGALVGAWFILLRRHDPVRHVDAAVAGSLLVLASFTPSLAMFSYVVLAHVAVTRCSSGTVLASLRTTRWILPLPGLIFLVDQFLLAPTGAMENSNIIDLKVAVVWGLFILMTSAAAAMLWSVRWRRTTSSLPGTNSLFPLLVGITLIALALLPYAAVGNSPKLRFPPYGLMGTRHELLLPFGTAVVVIAILRIVRSVVGRHAQRVVAVLLVLASALQSAVISASYWVEYEKQTQVMNLLRSSPLGEKVEGAALINIDDRTNDCNAITRNIRTDEWEALLAFATDGRFAGSVTYERPAEGSHQEDAMLRPFTVLVIENRDRRGCEVETGLLPLWNLAGLPRFLRLPALVVRRPDIEVIAIQVRPR